MTTKLTLTIDDAVISSAKKYAKKKNTSLSGIVENYLKSISAKELPATGISPEILKLMGSVKLADDFNYKKELGRALIKKYRK